MKFIATHKRKISLTFLFILVLNVCSPLASFALTSGPAQPETKGFMPAEVSDMVDLETGAFKYNIPLLDIDGYPINLNYQSGVGMDDEASWVGLGWSLNPGSINRQLRGVPDDFDGDNLETDNWTKPKVTIGARLTVKAEIGGHYEGSKFISNSTVPEGSFSIGVFNDSYTGIGAEVGVNAGISFDMSGSLTAGQGKTGVLSNKITTKASVGVNSNTTSGVDVSPALNINLKNHKDDQALANAGLSANLGYNTRSGLKDLTLGSTFSVSNHKKLFEMTVAHHNIVNAGFSGIPLLGTSISFNTEPITPKISLPYHSTYTSFSFDIGPNQAVFFGGAGGTGYKKVTEILPESKQQINPEFGYLYAQDGEHVRRAVMDFTREKDNPVIPELPNLAIPVATPDLFTFSSQTGSGQFRLYRGGSGAFFDNEVTDDSSTGTLGFDIGLGGYFHGGVTLFQQEASNTTTKWASNNGYLPNGDFQFPSNTNPNSQHAYFKQVGEKTLEDNNMAVGQLHGTEPLAVRIAGKSAISILNGNSNNSYSVNGPIQKTARQYNKTVISYLTADEAAKNPNDPNSVLGGALDKMIKYYDFNDIGMDLTTLPETHPHTMPRVDPTPDPDHAIRKAKHISEISVTDEQGKRMIYGTPVYNKSQTEYSYAIGKGYTPINRNQVANPATEGELGYNKGIDNYYHKEVQPAYASSFLLTGILSPDYVDKTGDGITADDLGTAIKFNYSIIDGFKWRTPYQNATVNKSLLADADDDKASIIYGEKELWYVHSIESKTKIAYFITANRLDGLGVTDWFGSGMDLNHRQKYLKEIRLYSKADRSKPIKVVKFEYDYELCKGIPNFNNPNPNPSDPESPSIAGKLTLKKIKFEYGNTTKGDSHPYTFSYDAQTTASNPDYGTLSTDRWGVYKPNQTSLPNDEFPYTDQNKAYTDINASVWHLKQITLPTGGIIKIGYESNDYAYVQDKRATVMTAAVPITSPQPFQNQPYYDNSYVISSTGGAFAKMTGFKVPVNLPDNSTDAKSVFEQKYLNGSQYIYSKMSVQMATNNSAHDANHMNDYVPCFSKIANVKVHSNYAYVYLEPRNQVKRLGPLIPPFVNSSFQASPVVFAAWQKMKEEYPRYAYTGFDRRIEDGNQSVVDAVTAICNAFTNLDELTENFYEKAYNNPDEYAPSFEPTKCFVRMVKADGFKLGGGVRVNKVLISDQWVSDTTHPQNESPHSYGQVYEYTTKDGDGNPISSGVATYEPAVGNDENALHEPVSYEQNTKGGISNYYDLETPFCESYYPAANVGYSQVTVTNVNENGVKDPLDLKTGYTVNEFYTAKDFPVSVSTTGMQRSPDRSHSFFSLVGTWSEDNLALSQGYSIILNDMHGKPKATRVFNSTGVEISSTVYYYNTSPNGDKLKLKNLVNVVKTDGTIDPALQVIGRDVEFYTDFREQSTINNGITINLGVDIIPAGFPMPLPHWPGGDNIDRKLFRSASAVKVSQYYGIIDSVVTTQNGSKITTRNLAYDGLTGQAVVTQTQNEFDQPIYSVNIPAYWAYNGMGGAYQNLGVVLSNLTTSATDGSITSYASFLTSGDELVDLNTGFQYYVIDEMLDSSNNPAYAPSGQSGVGGYIAPAGTYTHKKYLMDRWGHIGTNSSVSGNNIPTNIALCKVVRSGYRNMLGAGITSIVCLNNPIITDASYPYTQHLQIAQANSTANLESLLKVINASATTYDENWSVEQPDYHLIEDKTHNWYLQPINDFSNLTNQGTYLLPRTIYTGTAYSSEYNYGMNQNWPLQNSFWGTDLHGEYSRLGQSAVYPMDPILQNNPTSDNVFGFYATFNVPTSKTYYVGFGCTNPMLFAIDKQCDNLILLSNDVLNGYPLGTYGFFAAAMDLNAGPHLLHLELHSAPGYYYQGGGGAGIEIYDSDYLSSINTNYNINTLFSTSSLAFNKLQGAYVKNSQGITYQYTYTDMQHTPVTPCTTPPTTINPFVYGFKGNWRPYQTKVFQQNRAYENNNLLTPGSVINVKNAGYLSNFYSDWYCPGTQTPWIENTTSNATSKWTIANTVTIYDKYGQQLENKDALGRYSAALFGFNGELPVAVASNAMNREIYVGGFEDAGFKPGAGVYADVSPWREFALTGATDDQIYNYIYGSFFNDQIPSHTGRNCVNVPQGGFELSTQVYNKVQKTSAQLLFDSHKQFIKDKITLGLYPNGFEPLPGNPNGPPRQYVFSAWVKDGDVQTKSVSNTVTLTATCSHPNGASAPTVTPVNVTLKCKAIVEGWKQVEGVIDLSNYADGDGLKITFAPKANGNGQYPSVLFLDDIRIHPKDSQMKTYVYDNRSMRLMAELDENNFATFYEYDSEGLLIRVKKETEKGIMTLKESRSSYIKQ